MSPATARPFLAMTLNHIHEACHTLSEKSQEGRLSPDEAAESMSSSGSPTCLPSFHSKARQALNYAGVPSDAWLSLHHSNGAVKARARGLCEYCHLPEAAYPLSFHVDHIIAGQHGGKTRLGNLCLSCTVQPQQGPEHRRVGGRCHRTANPSAARPLGGSLHVARAAAGGSRRVGRVTIRVLGINDTLAGPPHGGS